MPGSAILPLGAVRLDPARELGRDACDLETDGQGTMVRGERSEFKLPAENPQEFPAVADFNESAYHELPARLLRELIRRTIFATDNESSRYALGGVLLEMAADKITAVGTDGRRLAKMEVPAKSVGGHQSGDSMTIVPTKAMQLIERALTDGDAEIQLAARANDVLVRSPRATIYSRLVEGRFPKWRDVFPQRTSASKIELTVGPFYSAVRQAAIVTSEESRGVDFTFERGTLVLSGRAAEVGQSRVELPIAYDGPRAVDHARPALRERFPQGARSRERSFTMELKDAESAAVCIDRRRLRLRDHAAGPRSLRRSVSIECKTRCQRRNRDISATCWRSLMARRGYARVQSGGACAEAWREAAGETLAGMHAGHAGSRGVCWKCWWPIRRWCKKWRFRKPALIKRLAELLPDENIRDLQLRVGPMSSMTLRSIVRRESSSQRRFEWRTVHEVASDVAGSSLLAEIENEPWQKN